MQVWSGSLELRIEAKYTPEGMGAQAGFLCLFPIGRNVKGGPRGGLKRIFIIFLGLSSNMLMY